MKKSDLVHWGDYLLLLALVAISGFPIFRAPIYIALYFVYLVVYLFIRRKAGLLIRFSKPDVFFILVFIILSCLHALSYRGFLPFSYLVLIVKLYTAIVVLKYMQFNFLVYYCKILKFLCVVSLCFWLIFIVFPAIVPLAFKLGIDVPYTLNDLDKTFLIYHLNPNAFTLPLVRNNSAFWEPGGFVLFIMVAIIFAFIIDKKIDYKHIGIYIVALITTFSTAGYIALIIFILLNYIFIKRKYIFGIFMLLISLYGYYKIDFLAEKIDKEIKYTEQKGSQNYRSRYGSLDLDLQIFSASPLIGRGYSLERFDYKIYGLLDEEKSNNGSISSPTDYLARFGLIGFTVYLSFVFYSFSVLFADKRKSFICVIVYLVIGLSQSCYFLSFFLTIPFLYTIKNK